MNVAVDDHSGLAYARILPEEQGVTCVQFLNNVPAFFACHGFQIREVMTDNALNYRRSQSFQGEVAALGACHVLTRPYSPWQNGKSERSNRSM
ncbi:hypothetical protein ACI1US_02325 [Leucobacter sp. BZR 635]